MDFTKYFCPLSHNHQLDSDETSCGRSSKLICAYCQQFLSEAAMLVGNCSEGLPGTSLVFTSKVIFALDRCDLSVRSEFLVCL